MKTCTKCKQDLDESCFSKTKQTKDGLYSSCRACRAVVGKNRDYKKYYADNAEKLRKQQRISYYKNAEKNASRSKKYREANKEAISARNAERRLLNIEKLRAKENKRRLLNIEKARERERLYRLNNPERMKEKVRLENERLPDSRIRSRTKIKTYDPVILDAFRQLIFLKRAMKEKSKQIL